MRHQQQFLQLLLLSCVFKLDDAKIPDLLIATRHAALKKASCPDTQVVLPSGRAC